jgi:hypothetical protein
LTSVEDITSKGRNKPVGDNRTRLPQEGTIDSGQHFIMRLVRPGGWNLYEQWRIIFCQWPEMGDRTLQRFRIESEPGWEEWRIRQSKCGFTNLASRKDGTWPAKELQKMASNKRMEPDQQKRYRT